jgi:hypothetical protein
VVAAEELMPEAAALAERLARRSPRVVAATKRLVYRGGSSSLQRGSAREQAEFVATLTRTDALAAFRRYAQQLDALGDAPYPADELLRGWRDGTEAEFAATGPATPVPGRGRA